MSMTPCFLCEHRIWSDGMSVCNHYSNKEECENFKPKQTRFADELERDIL